MKKIIFMILLSLVCYVSNSQNVPEKQQSFNTSGTIGVENMHVWRGLIFSPYASIIGNLSTTYKEKLTIGAFGAYSLNNQYNELDLFINYQLGNFNIGLTELYYPACIENYYSKTSHFLDGELSYKYKNLQLSGNVMLYQNNPVDSINKIEKKYSTYFEAKYTFYKNTQSL